jgi:predicted DNA-binding protein (MmcQ/YjbR family)
MAMKLEQICDLCMSFPGATEQIQWGEDVLFKVAGKMFVVVGPEPGNCFSFKCEEEAFHELTELPGILPAPYLARAQWVQIRPADCRLRAGEIAKLLRQSYELVVAKLPRKTQQALQDKTPKKAKARLRKMRTRAKR